MNDMHRQWEIVWLLMGYKKQKGDTWKELKEKKDKINRNKKNTKKHTPNPIYKT